MSHKKHLDAYHAKRRATKSVHAINVNEVHQETFSFNDRLATWVSQHVGTIWFCYGLATLMFSWALTMLVILPALHIQPPDPFPFTFLLFILGGIIQSLLMPLIMVAQNLASRHTEIRAESDHHINQANFKTLREHQDILEDQTAKLVYHTERMWAMDRKLDLVLKSLEQSRSRLVKSGARNAKRQEEEGGITQEIAAITSSPAKDKSA